MNHVQQMLPEGRPTDGIRRRDLITGLASALFLAGCGRVTPNRDAGTPATQEPASQGNTVSELLSQVPFLIAHRGSGDNWPEHTMAAYEGAVNAGASAIEVSVCATRDGVLICHHDTSTLRMTGVDMEIAETDYGRIALLKNDARPWIGPGIGLEPIPRLRDVLDRFAASHVIFIEDKQGTNTEALLDVMDSYPDAAEHFVWKQTAGGPAFEQAAARGYRTWGYFIDNADGQFATLAPNFDLLGIYHGASDEEISALVALGKPVVCWEIHTRWMRERVLALGVKGLMCSNYPYVAAADPPAGRDAFSTGVRAPGDLPWVLGLKYQPQLVTGEGALRMEHDSSAGYVLGSLGPAPGPEIKISLDIRWPDVLPGKHAGAGAAFGLADDQPYRAGIAGPTGGYHVILRGSGAVELYRRDPDGSEESAGGELLSVFPTVPPEPGKWTRLRAVMSPEQITVSREGKPEWSITVADTAYRGGYMGLLKSYKDPVPVEFRAVKVSSR